MTRHTQRLLLLAAALLAVLIGPCTAQQNNPQAVAPSFAVQPLYACKMEVKDMPQFEGMPSPEMTAGQLGLYAATLGMLDQWKIFNNGDSTDATNTPLGDPGDTSDDASVVDPTLLSARLQAKLSKAGRGKPGGSGSAGSSNRAAAPQPPSLGTQPPAASFSAAPAASSPPPPAHNYIVSRPGPGAVGRTVSAAASGPAAAAAELLLQQQLQQLQHRQHQQWRPSASRLAAAASAAGLLNTTRLGGSPAAAAAAAAAAAVAAAPLGASPLDAAVAAAASVAAEAEQQLGGDLLPGTSPVRRLFAAPNPNARHVCSKGTPTNSTTGPLGKSSFSSKVGSVLGITMADSGVIPADAAIAVGPAHVVHVVNSMVKILPVGANGEVPKSLRPGQVRLIPLPDWFGLVAAPCDGGYITPSATYDKEVGRFLISAICGGDSNQVLLSASANSSAMGTWILYSFAGEATQGTRMQCINESYPITFHSQIGYNKDGLFLSFIQNCPSNQETATGAIIYALPKWAVYKGATYFWCPGWTAWDIFDAVGQKNNDDLYPGAFVQMQPVLPQRAVDVQAEVTYFVGDNLSWTSPLKRNILTIAALINTGSLWLYEGPASNSPAPLLVARVMNRGMNCEIQTPDVKLTQPASDAAAGITQCQKLDGGAMRPPGVWDGGAALFANKIYIVDRGPDLAVPFMGLFMPTLYWAILSPSFCVGGPCGPWFGTDWGWADGWDWKTGTWLSDSERGRYGYKDPSYYNQVFLFPSTSQPPPTSAIQGRRRLQQQQQQQEQQQAVADVTGTWSGPIPGSGVRIEGREQMLHAVRAAKRHSRAVRRFIRRAAAAAEAAAASSRIAAASASASSRSSGSDTKGTALAMESLLGPALAHTASSYGLQEGTSASAGNSSSRRVAAAYASAAAWPNATALSAALHAGNVSAAAAGAGPDGANRTVSAAFFFRGGGSAVPQNFLWSGWGSNTAYFDYYQWWREHYFLRNLYMNLRIPPKVNPCKYYKDWIIDNEVTFGAINSKHGVVEFVSQGDNPVGLAAPALAVRGGSMLITYSYSGPFNVPLSNGGIRAFPGVGYTVIDVNAPSSSGGAFNLAQAGAGCVAQGGITRWGSYSGADVHFPSHKVWTAVEYAYQPADWSGISNAATQLNVFS